MVESVKRISSKFNGNFSQELTSTEYRSDECNDPVATPVF